MFNLRLSHGRGNGLAACRPHRREIFLPDDHAIA